MRTRPLKVALLGCGVVGSEVARIMTTHADDLAARIGAPVELAGVAVRRPSKVREGIDPALVTTDATALVKRGDIDVVVEVIGGIEPAGRSSPPRSSTVPPSSPRTRRCSRRTARRCTRPRRRTAGTSTTRPPSPVPSR